MSDEHPIDLQGAVCPVPLAHDERIVLGHGSGGKMTHDLVRKHFLPAFGNPVLRAGDDAGAVTIPAGVRLAVSTDSHVVTPLFFPGGDIGRLAICGTVNDVAMLGAHPLYLTAGFILEEGLEISVLERVIASMQQAALEAGVQIIAGDTKVVQRGKADGIYITTAGVGWIPENVNISGANAKPGDKVLLSGPVGDHGIAVLTARGELGLETSTESDVAPLNEMIAAILKAPPSPSAVHVLRDPTRGGLATTLCEIARQSQVNVLLNEVSIPIRLPVRAACELLGFDPLYIANEGKVVAIVSPDVANDVLMAMRKFTNGELAAIIGEIQPKPSGRVLLKTAIGSTRILDMLAGEMLPRIC